LDILESLIAVDKQCLISVNDLVGTAWLDQLMILASSKLASIPLYTFILYIIWKRFGTEQTLWILTTVAAMVVITDQGSVHFFKNVFQRLRPCHDLELSQQLVLVTGKCGGQFGFISSHAANVFGLSTFLVLIFSTHKWWLLLLVWAAIVSFSRVYLAVHYPFDVMVGAIFGMLVGWAVFRISNRIIRT
jgi:undecaprenyl-diphosphatase